MEQTTTLLPITRALFAVAFSYLIGSIPMGLIVGFVTKGIDVREYGSGNVGMTNVIRTLGWGPGLATGLLDFFKGYLPLFFVLRMFSPDDFGGVSTIYEIIVIMVALFLITGNMFPVYLLFKGGKGVATGLGVFSALMGVYIFIPLAVFGLFLFLFRFVSLASMTAAVTVPLTVLFLKSRLDFISSSETVGGGHAFGLLFVFTFLAAILVIWSHRINIARIYAGKEPRIGHSNRKSPPRPPSGVPEEASDVRPPSATQSSKAADALSDKKKDSQQ